MKKKNNSSNLVTKVFLKDELKNLETSLHLKITSLEIKVDTKLEEVEKRIDNNAQRYRDQILVSNDKLVKQLESMMDENTIGFSQLNRQLQNHEKRIKKIEQIQQTP